MEITPQKMVIVWKVCELGLVLGGASALTSWFGRSSPVHRPGPEPVSRPSCDIWRIAPDTSFGWARPSGPLGPPRPPSAPLGPPRLRSVPLGSARKRAASEAQLKPFLFSTTAVKVSGLGCGRCRCAGRVATKRDAKLAARSAVSLSSARRRRVAVSVLTFGVAAVRPAAPVVLTTYSICK